MKRPIYFILAGIACMFGGSVSAGTLIEYSAGHADIELSYGDHDDDHDHGHGGGGSSDDDHHDELTLQYHFGSTAVLSPAPADDHVHADDAYIRVGDTPEIFAQGGALEPLGLTGGERIWLAPQNNVAGLPFVGIAASLPADTFIGATLSMSDFSGPGDFALWKEDSTFGNETFFTTVDGVASTGALPVGLSGHSHYQMGFTQQGVYNVELTATADLVGGGSMSTTETFRFAVGDLTAIPEPGSFAALALTTAGLLVRRRRKS